MVEKPNLFRMLGLWRAVGAAIALLVGFSGAPKAASAFACYDYTIRCTDAQDCVDHLHEPCDQPGPCTGEVVCRLASSTIDCNNHPEADVAMTCQETTPE